MGGSSAGNRGTCQHTGVITLPYYAGDVASTVVERQCPTMLPSPPVYQVIRNKTVHSVWIFGHNEYFVEPDFQNTRTFAQLQDFIVSNTVPTFWPK